MIKTVLELPFDSASIYESEFDYFGKDDIVIKLFYLGENNEKHVLKLIYEEALVYQNTGERCAWGWQNESWETISEIQDSPWLKELRAVYPEVDFSCKHISMVLNDIGCIDIACKDLRIERV